MIRDHYVNGVMKVLLWLATGGGKTKMFCDMMNATAANGKRALMAVRGRELVEQASKRLAREEVSHGVHMAGHWNFRPKENIQCCSIDTLNAREIYPPADFVVIDEVHMATSPGYMKFLAQYPNARILGVTATPYTDKSLRHVADVIVRPTTMKQLIEDGHLVETRYFAPSEPDLTGVQVSRSTGDYMLSDLAAVMNESALVGNIVRDWLEHGQNRSTICFATSVQHSKYIVEQFLNVGVRAEHCDADTEESERVAIMERHARGETQIISNVGILCTGVDMPWISCIIMARPTKSLILYIQQVGRGTRPFPGKSDCLLLDHAGNVLRHGFAAEEPDANLDGLPVKKDLSPRTCSYCYAVFYGFSCECGYQVPEQEKARELLEIEGKLKEITELPLEAQVLRDIKRLKKERKARGFKSGWVYHQIRIKYGDEIAERYFKKRELPAWAEFQP